MPRGYRVTLHDGEQAQEWEVIPAPSPTAALREALAASGLTDPPRIVIEAMELPRVVRRGAAPTQSAKRLAEPGEGQS